MSTKWVVVLDTEAWAIGPFGKLSEATAYRDTDMERDSMRVMEIVRPARGWNAFQKNQRRRLHHAV